MRILKTSISTYLARPYEGPSEDSDKLRHGAQLNSPELNEEGVPQNKAISSAEQAHAIAKALKKAAIEKGGRLELAGTVASLYNMEQPFPQKALNNAGQDWRANFSSGFLSSIVDRVTPQLRDPIYRAETLTHASLPETEGSAQKTRQFQEAITKLIRSWKGWNDFVSILAQDVVLHGGATPGRISADWRPKLFRPDQCYLFEKSDQHASKLQVVVFWEPILIHDFLDIIRDKEAAQLAGYNLEGCYKAANESSNPGDKTEKTQLEEQDIIREKGNLQSAAENQGKVVNLFHVFVREYDGKLALWTVAEDGKHEVRHVEDCEEDLNIEGMIDAVSLFTLQVGNGKFYGSKGLGRLLANLHKSIERGRCLAIDQNYLSGLPILNILSSESGALSIVVQHPFIIIKGKVEVAKQTITFDATNWKELHDMLVGLAEQIAGAFIPPNLNTGGAANTKIEAAQKAEREIAVRQGVLGRFFAQFADLIGMMIRAILSPDNVKEAIRIHQENQEKKKTGLKVLAKKIVKFLAKIFGKEPEKTTSYGESKLGDEEAVYAIVELLEKGITPEDLACLRDSAHGADVEGSTAERDQKTQQWIAANAMNPYMNKKKASEMSAKIECGEDRAKELLNRPLHDPEDIAVATREQISEWLDMIAGEAVPVAATDIHIIHREALVPRLGQFMGIIQKALETGVYLDPSVVLTARIANDHLAQHLQLDQDTPEEEKAQHIQMVQTWDAMAKQGEQLVKKQAAEQAKQDEAMAQQQAAQGQPATPEQIAALGQLKNDERKLDLEERKQDHTERMDGLNLIKDVALERAEAAKEGVKDADAQAAEKQRIEQEQKNAEQERQDTLRQAATNPTEGA